MELIEDNGLVSLYRGTNNEVIVSYDERFINLESKIVNPSLMRPLVL